VHIDDGSNFNVITTVSSVTKPVVIPNNPNTASYISMKKEALSLEDFDYAVLHYIWSDDAGQDLDTRTQLQFIDRDNPILGWNRVSQDSDYMIWSGDNTGFGEESILINMTQLLTDFTSDITIETSAFWYKTKKTGNVTLEITTYKGGIMNQSGYTWENSGGKLVQTLNIQSKVDIETGGIDSNGQKIAKLIFNSSTKRFSLIRL
jgi:hypothetical protein